MSLVLSLRQHSTLEESSTLADDGRIVKMWFKKAAEDLRASKLLLAQGMDDLLGPAVFHAQQSAEKAIKGYLASNKIRFPKTHDIEILLLLVNKINPGLSSDLEKAAVLTKFAVAYRYPEEAEPPEPLTHDVCQKLVNIAVHVFDELSTR